MPPRDHQAVIDRFVEACQADERVVAAFLIGSLARGDADEHSDLDLCLIATDEARDDLWAERRAFIEQLGEPLFVEDFDGGRDCRLLPGRGH
jgi:predicted nucleotidyltransferase